MRIILIKNHVTMSLERKYKNFMNNKIIIQLINISKKYVMKDSEVLALDSVNYNFSKGKFYAIMGHSGSGKSTLINILGTLVKPTIGKYLLDEKDISSLNDDEISEIRNKKVGLIFQNYNLEEHMKAYENVMLPLLLGNDSLEDMKQKAIVALNNVNLQNRINHFPKELSGGEQQRVSIARALVNDPDIILADEPTGNLDEENEEKIFKILKDISNLGKCVIVVSHSEKVKTYADVVLTLNKGKLRE